TEENMVRLRHQSLGYADHHRKHGVEQGRQTHQQERSIHHRLPLLHLHDVAWHRASAHIELERVHRLASGTPPERTSQDACAQTSTSESKTLPSDHPSRTTHTGKALSCV